MALTGRPDGAPLVPPDVIVDRIRALDRDLPVDPLALLGERAALGGLHRGGAVSCGGATRLLRARDAWITVSLARTDDLAMIPAWLELDPGVLDPNGLDPDGLDPDVLDAEPSDDGAVDAPWTIVERTVANRRADDVVERGCLLGLPVARRASRHNPLTSGEATAPALPARIVGIGDVPRLERPAIVVDLSSLWAGPLCGHLLGLDGHRVIKIESTTRPDGARGGPAAFFDLLHAGQESVAVDFRTRDGIAALRTLIAAADVVIEASRPRALEQLGIRAEEQLRTGPRVWVSITGYGRSSNRVAFGDDAAVAGGLVADIDDGSGPCFVADAIADPLAGTAAAAAARTLLASGGRWLVDVAMADVAASVAAGAGAWRTGDEADAARPRARVASGCAPALGEHTEAVLAELASR